MIADHEIWAATPVMVKRYGDDMLEVAERVEADGGRRSALGRLAYTALH